MSLYGALYAGVAGLQAQSNKLGIISDNVANVNTVGYKQGSATFETLVTSASNATAYSPGGVLGSNAQLISTQGLLQTTSSPTDIAISGNGFFVVNQKSDQSGQVLYTRAGSFTQDSTGNFVNSGGFYLQAWPLDHDGQLPGAPGNTNTISSANLTSLQTVNVQNLTGTASPTTSVSLSANLKASQAIFTGAGGTATLDSFDTTNNGVNAESIIVPSSVDSITRGDKFSITTGAGVTSTYTYGGFTQGRNITDPTAGGYGDSNIAAQKQASTLTQVAGADLNNTAITPSALSSSNGTRTVTVSLSHAQALALTAGDYVNISGIIGSSGLFNNLDVATVNGTHIITGVDINHNTITYTATGSTNTANASTATLDTPSVTPAPIIVGTTTGVGSSAVTSVTIAQAAPAGMVAGDYITLSSSATDPVDGLTLNGTFKITSVTTMGDGRHFTVAVPGTASTPTTGIGLTGNITVTPQSISTISGTQTITVYQPNSRLVVGDKVSFSGIPSGGIGGVTQATLQDSTFTVASVSADGTHYTFNVPVAAEATASTGAGNGALVTQVTSRTLNNLAGTPLLATAGSPVTLTPQTVAAANDVTTGPKLTLATLVTVTVPSTTGLTVGDYVTITNEAAPVDGITIPGTYKITALSGTSITFNSGQTAAAGAQTGGAGGEIVTPAPVAVGTTTSGVTTVTLSQALPAGLVAGDFVTLSGLGTVDNMNLDGTFQITATDPLNDSRHFSIAVVDATAGTPTNTNVGGGAGLALTVTPAPLATGTTAGTPPFTPVTISQPLPTGMAVGDYVNILGATGTVDGLTVNGTFKITGIAVDGKHFTVSVPGTALAGNTAGGAGSIVVTPQTFSTVAGTTAVTVFQPNNNLAVGDVVTFSSVPAAVGGIPATALNNSFVVKSISSDGNHYTIQVPQTNAAETSSGGGNTSIVNTRPFVGTILDAVNSTQPFLGTTGTLGFTPAGLTFSITTAVSGTSTFSYQASSPDVQQGQFNDLSNLASAIDNISGLSARVVNGRLYVSAENASDAVTFQNGSTTGVDGPPVQGGINWVRELGLSDIGPGTPTFGAATNTFSSLQSLSDLVNGTPGLSSTVTNPLGSASLSMTLNNPLDTITFTDASASTVNNGSLLAALGLVHSLQGAAYTTPKTTGAIGPSYDPSDATKNITSGAIGAPFSKPITIYDAQGYSHNLNIAAIKVSTNTWAVEVFAPAGDIGTSPTLIASGDVIFNGDGSLASVASSLTNPLNITWADQAAQSHITINWGTAGHPFGSSGTGAVGKTDGLSQFDSDFNTNSTSQDGAPVGKLTGVSIDGNGFIIASYSNGQTQKLYQIPIANFTDPNQLQSISGNTYAQTNGSGEVNLKQAGGSGVGTISSGALETSNVELANQLTDMIVAQRAYQANTKVISTADQLLNDLDQILQ